LGQVEQIAEYFAADAGTAAGRICVQIFQFWRRLTNQMTYHQVG